MDCLECEILSAMIDNHVHAGNKKEIFIIKKDVSTTADWDKIGDKIDDMLDNYLFIIQDSGGIWLSQRDYGEELVDFYENECGEDPQWFKERLDHVPNEVWYKRDLRPPRS